MIRIKKISTKTIVAIGMIWLLFIVAGSWFEMHQAKSLAIHEIKRWGIVAGENVRIALNSLMREGKMEARFGYFDNLSDEISELNSIRVIRSPRVNEIFLQVRQERDIPRERENIQYYRESIVELLQQLDVSQDPDEKDDIINEITNLSYDINHSEIKILEYTQPMLIDQRELARDKIENQVLETGEPVFIVDENTMRMVAPYKVRKTGCSEASGCHFYANEGDILGAIDINFSIEGINNETRNTTINNIAIKIFFSLMILVLIYLSMRVILFKNIDTLLKAIKNVSNGDLNTRLSLKRRSTDKTDPAKTVPENEDEFYILFDGFNTMTEKLQQHHNKLDKMAHHDGLTGLSNRRKFNSALHSEMEISHRQKSQLSLLLIDIDNFKMVNDTYGHQTGDEVLRKISTTIKKQTRDNDITSRYGGEEISVILPSTSYQDAIALAERIRYAIEQQIILNSVRERIELTVSIGVSNFPTDVDTEEELISAADTALYNAKHSGRNCVKSFSVSK